MKNGCMPKNRDYNETILYTVEEMSECSQRLYTTKPGLEDLFSTKTNRPLH